MERKTLLVGGIIFILIAIVIAGALIFAKPPEFRGTTYVEPYPAASDFQLERSDGSSFELSQMRGKIVLLFFGYTSCPDVCPTTLAELNQALEKLDPNDIDKVRVVFITVDPDRDSPARVQEYVNHFNGGFIGLSGSESQLQSIWNNYGVFREIVDNGSGAGYLVDHTARVTLIDGDGNLRISFGFDLPVEDIVHDLKLILKEN